YMAPEQANGEADRIGPRTDVFGLGAILYTLLTGRPPYQGTDPVAVWGRARQGQVAPLREVNPQVPPALERICLKALAREPEQRFASAAELATALHRFLRRRLLTALLGGTVLLAAALVAWHFLYPRPRADQTPPVVPATPLTVRKFEVRHRAKAGA